MRSGSDRPTFERELALLRQGYEAIAGLDEAGRGAWAGPVVAAAVILPLKPARQASLRARLDGLNDSKQVSPLRRLRLFEVIRELTPAVGVGFAGPEVVDCCGLIPATRQAMRQALQQLNQGSQPDFLLLDALDLPGVDLPQAAFPKADALSLTVAAASIMAKVSRDRLMVQLDQRYPGYHFARHKGYGTPQHRQALAKLGPCPIHRMSYAPLRHFTQRPRLPGPAPSAAGAPAAETAAPPRYTSPNGDTRPAAE